jgi:hypothetical protein
MAPTFLVIMLRLARLDRVLDHRGALQIVLAPFWIFLAAFLTHEWHGWMAPATARAGVDDGVGPLFWAFQAWSNFVALAAGWHGIGDLTLPVYGDRPYWLAFEVPTEDFGSGAMPPTPTQGLDLYAIDSGAGYVASTDERFGIRVLPEPQSMTMIVCGAGALMLAAHSKRSRLMRERIHAT